MGQPVNIIRDARSYGKAAHHQKQRQSCDLSVGQEFTHIASHYIASRRRANKQRGSAKSDQTRYCCQGNLRKDGEPEKTKSQKHEACRFNLGKAGQAAQVGDGPDQRRAQQQGKGRDDGGTEGACPASEGLRNLGVVNRIAHLRQGRDAHGDGDNEIGGRQRPLQQQGLAALVVVLHGKTPCLPGKDRKEQCQQGRSRNGQAPCQMGTEMACQ